VNYFDLETNFVEAIEQEVIRRNKNCFKIVKVWFVSEEKNDNIHDILQVMDGLNLLDVKLDEYLNELISIKPYLYDSEEKNITGIFIEREARLKTGGELFNQHYPIYYDSSKLDMSFSISDIRFLEEIEEGDIDKILPVQPNPEKENFIVDIKGVDFNVEKIRAREYVRAAFIKIEVEVEINIGKQICGLIVEGAKKP
jgi:hypothetical protein